MLENANLLNNSFKNKIDSNIYNRGFDYYKNGWVTITDSDRDLVKAIVSGNQDYKVIIVISKNGEFAGTCNCPAFSKQKICKHIAATLICINENQSQTDMTPRSNLLKLISNPIYKNRQVFSYQANLITKVFKEFVASLDNIDNDEIIYQEIHFYIDSYYKLNSFLPDHCNFHISSIIKPYIERIINNSSYYKELLMLCEQTNVKTKVFLNFLFDSFVKVDITVQNIEILNLTVNKLSNYLDYNFIRDVFKINYYNLDKEEAVNNFLKTVSAKKRAFNELITFLKNNNNIEMLIKLIENNIEESFVSDSALSDLILLHKKNGIDSGELIVKILHRKIMANPSYDNYAQLKQLYNPVEWQKKKLEYIKLFRYDNDLMPIYILEEDYASAIKIIKHKNDINFLANYVGVTLKYDKKSVEKLVKQQIFKILNSDYLYDYDSVLTLIAEIVKFEEGRELIKNILDYIYLFVVEQSEFATSLKAILENSGIAYMQRKLCYYELDVIV